MVNYLYLGFSYIINIMYMKILQRKNDKFPHSYDLNEWAYFKIANTKKQKRQIKRTAGPALRPATTY